mgnify:FL=1
MFYAIYPFLNSIIRDMNQFELAKVTIVLFVIYYVVGFVLRDIFYVNHFIRFIVMFMVISYIKKFKQDEIINRSVALKLMMFGVAGLIGFHLFIEFVGLKVAYIGTSITRWTNMSNPFCFVLALGTVSFCLCMNSFCNNLINVWANRCLLIYIIHENYMVRVYIRPLVHSYIYNRFGYNYIVLWVILMGILLFTSAAFLGCLYDISIRKYIHKFGSAVFGIVSNVIDNFIMKSQKCLIDKNTNL